MIQFTELVKEYGQAEIWILGYQTKHINTDDLPDFVKTFNSIEQVVEQL
jgi:hypothetical protein